MIRFGSDTFRVLKKMQERPLWANEGMPTNFYRLRKINLIDRKRLKKQENNGFCFMNQYYITEKGQQELKEVETREAIKVHEERYFCF